MPLGWLLLSPSRSGEVAWELQGGKEAGGGLEGGSCGLCGV